MYEEVSQLLKEAKPLYIARKRRNNRIKSGAAMLAVSVNAEAGEHKFKHPQGEPPRHEQMAEKLAQDLGLTAEQKAQAEKIRADGREKVKPLMERAKKLHEEMDKLRQENMQEFEKILTPDQQEKFAKIKAEMKKYKGPRGPHPKFDDKEVGLRLAFIGSINDEILSITDLAYELIKFLQLNYCQSLVDRYNINEDADSVHILEQIAEKRACIKKGGELDIDKAAALLLDDFRAGKLGRISLERPAVVKDK